MDGYAEGVVITYDSIFAKEYAGFMLEQIVKEQWIGTYAE